MYKKFESITISDVDLRLSQCDVINSSCSILDPTILLFNNWSLVSHNLQVTGKEYSGQYYKHISFNTYVYQNNLLSKDTSYNNDIYDFIYSVLLPKTTIQLYSTEWDNITFKNEYIEINSINVKCRLKYSKSKVMYNDLRYLLKAAKFTSPHIHYDTKLLHVTKITGLSLIEEIFDFMEVEIELRETDLEKIQQIKNITYSWDNYRILSAYRIQERSVYLNYLCSEFLDEKYRIKPVKEIRASKSNKTMYIEIAFIFTAERKRFIYLIWESQETSRATFVFRSKLDTYEEAVQKLFDYIVSDEVLNKREKLHSTRMNYFNSSIIKYIGSVTHISKDFEGWQRRLENLLV